MTEPAEKALSKEEKRAQRVAKLASATPPTPAKAAAKTATKQAAKKAAKKTATPGGSSQPSSSKTTPAQKTTQKRSQVPKEYAKKAASSGRRAASKGTSSVLESHRKTASGVQAKYRKEKILGIAEMRPKVRMLAAEYVFAVVVCILFLFVPDKTYHEKMSRFFIQMTGVSGVFFMLALGSSSEKTSRWTIPFGLLIDVAMLIHLLRQNIIPNLVNPNLGKLPDHIEIPDGIPISYETQLDTYNQADYVPPFEIVPGITTNIPENPSIPPGADHSGGGSGIIV